MSKNRVTKGMILCAGMGTRLLPITEKTPKPIVPVLNVANLLHTLFLFKKAGIQEIIVNTFHLGSAIESFLKDGREFGIHLEYSREPQLLGTGGGIKKAEPFFGKDTFIVANCDFVSDIEIRPVIEKHLSRKALATMILFQDSSRQALYSKVGVNARGELCSLPKLETESPEKTGIFTGIHVLDPETLQWLKPEPSGVNDVLYPYLMKNASERVLGEFVPGYWYDTGELESLWSTTMTLLKKLGAADGKLVTDCLKEFGGYEEVKSSPGVWTAKSFPLPKEVRVMAPAVLGKNLTFEGKVTIGPLTVIGDNSRVGTGAHITKSILLPEATVSAQAKIENALVSGTHTLTIKR